MSEYKHLRPLAGEVISAKLREVLFVKNYTKPFFKENPRTGEVELVIPAKSLNRLEREVLKAVGYSPKPVRVGDGVVMAFVIPATESMAIDSHLSELILKVYRGS
ncbi:hypothetical protein [Thermococcus sp. 21S7]|uniref:hypothetical protein n=1 Tax=Thermococcus sp. 21S7 TaxID=1638221 RepID=UPI00143958F6|nr:hypothetical protein [Thermococcus sp. 21S7]NJE62380.1 hypothetical protein [Thermococcus sp. 21S7]